MLRRIDERPELASGFGVLRLLTEEPRADAEQKATADLKACDLLDTPGKGLQQWQPAIFEPRQFPAGNPSWHELIGDGLQPRLGRRGGDVVEFVQSFAPPGETDCAQERIAAGRDDIGKREVEVPQCQECGPQRPRQLLKRDLAVGIEPPLSDR
jgi:hypothetical protein